MASLRLMSTNLWKCDENLLSWEKQGLDCSARVRAEGFCKVFFEVTPDVIGLQESSDLMLELIVSGMKKKGIRYEVVNGKDTPILYRADKLELVDATWDVYPDTVPGFDGIFNNDKTKSYSMALFKVKGCDKSFIFTTTHLWWKSSNPQKWHYQYGSDEARAYQMGIVIEKIEELQNKHSRSSVVVGDFNTPYDSYVIKYAQSRGFAHAHDVATEYACEEHGYHVCNNDGYKAYEPMPFENSIDHILVKDAPKDFVKRFERYTPDYYLALSDHFPAFIDVEL